MKIFYILTIVCVIGAMLFTVRKMVVYMLRKSLAAAWWFVTSFIIMYIGRPIGGDIQENLNTMINQHRETLQIK